MAYGRTPYGLRPWGRGAQAPLATAGDLSGTIAGTSAVDGALGGFGPLTGAVTGTSAVDGALGGFGPLTGAVTGSSAVAGTLGGAGGLSGTITGTSAVAGILFGPGLLAGTVAGLSALAGTLSGSGATTRPSLELGLAAIAAQLRTALPGVPVHRGRRSAIGTDESLPILVLRMGSVADQGDDAFGLLLLRCEAVVEGYARAAAGASDPDAALELALAELHANCVAALSGVEIQVGSAGLSVMVLGGTMEPDAALLAASAEAEGSFAWSINFDLRAAVGAGPFTTP